MLLSYTSLTLATLLHPKIQESFDPFFHTLPPTFASGVPQEVWGESKRGWGGQGTRAFGPCDSKKKNKRLFAAQQRQHEKRER